MDYKAVFIDIDDTLFNFRQSSFEALTAGLAHFGVPFTWEQFLDYEHYNNALWWAYERGEIEKDLIFTERFRRYMADHHIQGIAPEALNALYIEGLAQGTALMPHARELLEALHGRYKVFVVTNGDTYAQESRIARSGLAGFFDQVFISEQMGCKKPEKAFFDKVFAIVGEEYRSCSLLLGDSLTSDMQGGRNAGIPTCFYGPAEQADDRCDHVIGDLLDVLPILAAGR